MIEKQVEDRLVNQLLMLGYEKVEFKPSFKMVDNIRMCLNKVFKKDYTVSEIEKILNKIQTESDKNSKYAYTFNEILDKGIYLKLRSDEETNMDNKPYIRIFDKTSAQNNIFQVATQLTDKGDKASRYDVTLLVNGFPVVQIELKRADVEIDEAINQINRYTETAFTGLFKYIQLFVVSNDTETKYGINTNKKINKLFMFNWSDEKNNITHDLIKFTDSFLNIHNLFNMITNYIIRYNTGEGKMIVLRPYQIFAIKAAIKKVTLPEDARVGRNMNGYIFHTTGSGKTVTSWKCVQMMQELPGVAKVVFLVDRRDLDSQTTAEFKSIDSSLDIEDTPNTNKLLKAFETKKSIITTVQKMSIAIKKSTKNTPNYEKRYEDVFERYKDKRVIFIIDECHRTQYGEMHRIIERYFTNSLYIGFTGTPLYEQNKGTNDMTTKELFGEEIHSYRIKDAIRDRNVLGFSIDYYNTVQGNELLNTEQTYALDTSDINRAEVLMNPTRIKNIVDKIYEIHDKKTQNRKYTALFAVDSIKSLLVFYDAFKEKAKTIENEEDRLKVSAIFTALESETDKSDKENTNYDRYKEIMEDFNKMCNSNCKDDESFRAELVRSLRKERPNNTDIVIVVGIFLTGFDSKMTNTLYVDNYLYWHNLLQAFSRTNRVETESKPFGNIVCFRGIKVAVDDAIALFNYGKDDSSIVAKSYESVIKDLEHAIDEINDIIGKDIVITDKGEHTKEEFVKAMRELNHQLNQAKQFIEFSWDKIDDKLTKDDYQKLIGQLKSIKEETDKSDDMASALKYVDFRMELVEQDKIDLDYIKNLINNIDLSNFEALEKSVKEITKLVDKSNSETLRDKKDLIKEFLNKLVMESQQQLVVESEAELLTYFRQWVINKKQEEINQNALETNLTVEDIDDELLSHSIIGKVDKKSIDNKVKERNPKSNIRERKTLREKLYNFISSFTSRFENLI